MNFPTEYREKFKENGFLLLEDFYDFESEILPIQEEAKRIILAVCRQSGIEVAPLLEFDSGLQLLIAKDRALASKVYDAIKKLPSFFNWLNSDKNKCLAKFLLNTGFLGIAHRGFGIRLDHPNEDQYLTQIHQDYTSQLCSPKGVVFWSPLRNVDVKLGPVKVVPSSHKLGVQKIIEASNDSYGMRLKDEVELNKLDKVALEVKVNDLFVLDYLTLHESSPNRSNQSRWALISRYFDFLNDSAAGIGWKGGLQEGNLFSTVHPELTVSE